MKKRTKSFLPGIIIMIVAIVALILVGSISSSVLRTILTIALIVAIAAAVLMVLLVIFANKSGQGSPAPNASVNRTSPMSPEQSDSLKKAGSQLTRIRMGVSRFQNQELSRAGIEACSSVEKVLRTLKEKPEKIQTTRQLFNYYLPTMEQVVDRYHKIEESGTDNPEISGNVKKYFDDITEAMQSQYEALFDNDKLNVAVDMEAMTIALKRDGLLDEDAFRETKKEAESAGVKKPEEQQMTAQAR